MPDRRGRKSSADDLLPNDLQWARDTWADREAVVKLPAGAWMLRHAANRLCLDQSEVDQLLNKNT